MNKESLTLLASIKSAATAAVAELGTDAPFVDYVDHVFDVIDHDNDGTLFEVEAHVDSAIDAALEEADA